MIIPDFGKWLKKLRKKKPTPKGKGCPCGSGKKFWDCCGKEKVL